eukprot:1408409-Rhodomonas_salina.1
MQAAPPPPAIGPPAMGPPPGPTAALPQQALAPARNRSIGLVVPACIAVIGANVPNALNTLARSCYLCGAGGPTMQGTQGHLAFSCMFNAQGRLGEPFPGW